MYTTPEYTREPECVRYYTYSDCPLPFNQTLDNQWCYVPQYVHINSPTGRKLMMIFIVLMIMTRIILRLPLLLLIMMMIIIIGNYNNNCRDPEGTLASIPTVLTTFIGMHFGNILLTYKDHGQRLKHWGIFAFVLFWTGCFIHIGGPWPTSPPSTLLIDSFHIRTCIQTDITAQRTRAPPHPSPTCHLSTTCRVEDEQAALVTIVLVHDGGVDWIFLDSVLRPHGFHIMAATLAQGFHYL